MKKVLFSMMAVFTIAWLPQQIIPQSPEGSFPGIVNDAGGEISPQHDDDLIDDF